MTRTFLLAITLASLLSGCAIFGEAVDKIAGGVEKYCEQPYTYRSDFRNTVNTALQGTGHTVHVHCAGDPDHETTSISDPLDAVIFEVIDNGGIRYDHRQAAGSIAPKYQEGASGIEKERSQETRQEKAQDKA